MIAFVERFLALSLAERKQVFQNIQRQSDAFSYNMIEAERPENRERNRYSNIHAPNSSRIKLLTPSPTTSDSPQAQTHSNYINANHIHINLPSDPSFSQRSSHTEHRTPPASEYNLNLSTPLPYCAPRVQRGIEYIVGQYPLPRTKSDFWWMVSEQGIRVVLTLSRLKEGASNQGHVYWPNAVGETLTFDRGLIVELVSAETQDGITVRELLVDRRKVMHIEFLRWPDFQVCTKQDLKRVIEIVWHAKLQFSHNTNTVTMYVHCSAGVGRTGVYCVIDCVLRLLQLDTYPSDSDCDVIDLDCEEDLVAKTLLRMRKQRPNLVQTFGQFELCYEFLQYYLQTLD